MGIKVRQYNTKFEQVGEYNSYSEAAKVLGVNESTIRKGVKWGRLVCGKFYFVGSDKTVKAVDTEYKSLQEIFPEVKYSDCPIEPKSKEYLKVLMLDIETAPLRSYTWGLWKQNVGLNQIISNWYMISWAAKWLGDFIVQADVLTSDEAIEENDERIIQSLWKLLDEADIVIAHNGDKFDIPKINTRFVLYDMVPPSPYKQIDTLTVARQTFGFSSNRLDYLAQFFRIGSKIPTTFELWEDCMAGDKEALRAICEYNQNDVVILEDVYLRLRPYIKGHPNLDLYKDNTDVHCPHCGKVSLTAIPNKFFYTQAVKYQVYRCKECGSLSRAKKGVKFENARQVSAIPR